MTGDDAAPAVQPSFIDVRGVRTRVFAAGAGEPLVLVHGGHFGDRSSADDWSFNIRPLAKRFRVLAYDKVGQGHSDLPARDSDYVMATATSNLVDFLDVQGIQAAHLVGHSRGGYTIVRMALEHPERVKSIAIVSSATLMIPPNPIYREWERCSKAIENRRDRLRYLVTANSFAATHITTDFLDALETMESLPSRTVAAVKMRDGLEQPFNQDLVARQKETHEWIRRGGIKVPTLVLWGYDDPSARFDPIGIDLVRLFMPSVPRCEVHVLNQAGHYVFREQAAGFNAALGSFVAAQADASR